MIGALLLGKWIAAQIVGRQFAYTPAARNTMGSLTLPQVAATLAAALVGFTTFDPAGERLIDTELLNVVLVLVLTTLGGEERLSSVMRLLTDEDKVSRIRVYAFCPDSVAEIAAAKGLPVEPGWYSFRAMMQAMMGQTASR